MNLSNDNIVTILTCFITGIIGYMTCRFTLTKPQRIATLSKQFYKVYLPLFKKLESNLYSNISINTLKEYIDFFNILKTRNYELIDSNLMYMFAKLEISYHSNEVDLDLYYDMCYRLDVLFESTRKKLHLPARTFQYKLLKHQYIPSSSKRYEILSRYLLKTFIILVALILILFFIVYTLYGMDYIVSIINPLIIQATSQL